MMTDWFFFILLLVLVGLSLGLLTLCRHLMEGQ